MDKEGRKDWIAIHLILVVLISALQFGIVLGYAGDKPLPMGKDEGMHLRNASQVHHILEKGLSPAALYRELVNLRLNYPPLVYLLSAAAKRIVRAGDVFTSLLSLIPFVIAMNLGLFLLGRRYHSPGAGYAAILVNASIPALVRQMAIYNMALPQAGLMPLVLYMLCESRGLTDLRMTIAAAILIALGSWIHFTFLVYALPVVLAAAIVGLAAPNKARTLLGLGGLILVAAILTAPYFLNPEIIFSIRERIGRFSSPGYVQGDLVPGLPAPWNRYLFYPYAVVFVTFGPLRIAALLILWIALLRKEKFFSGMAAVAILAPVILFAPWSATSAERLVPVLPAASVAAVLGALSFERRRLKGAVTAALLVACFFSAARATVEESLSYSKMKRLDLKAVALDLNSHITASDHILAAGYDLEWLEYYAEAYRLPNLKRMRMVGVPSQQVEIPPSSIDLALVHNREPWFEAALLNPATSEVALSSPGAIVHVTENPDAPGAAFVILRKYDFGPDAVYWILHRAREKQ